MSLLGIDVGTTGCKAAAYSTEGFCFASAYREYPTLYPAPGEAELDSRYVWNCIKQCIAEVASKTRTDPVTALSVSTMSEAATPVTADRRILGNCILSSDMRGSQYADRLRAAFGPEGFYDINANLLGPGYTMPKIAWTRDHLPELYHKADKFLLWGGLVEFLLGCDPFTTFSHASRTLLFDIRQETWSPALIKVCDIDPAKLPPCLASGVVAGTVSGSIAQELGLPKTVKIVVGGHDQCCNALGAGIFQPGQAVDGIGTFECITPVYNHIPPTTPMLKNGLNVEHHVLEGLYVSFLFNQAGSVVRWFRNTFAVESRHLEDIYARLDREMPAEPTNLFFLPYLAPSGSPRFIADASGVIVGLKVNTNRGDILKAILESTTFYFVESLDALKGMGVDTSEFIATGGGAKSDAWLQIKADIFGVPFVRPAIIESGLLGTAILAGVATGEFKNVEEATTVFVRRERTFEPDTKRHAVYRERLSKYQELFPLMYPFLRRL
jgi:xylulokinase